MASRLSGVAVFLSLCALPVMSRPAQTAPAESHYATLRGAWTEVEDQRPPLRGRDAGSEGTASSRSMSVRSFGAILAHVAGASYEFCVGGERARRRPTPKTNSRSRRRRKADIVKALDGAIALLRSRSTRRWTMRRPCADRERARSAADKAPASRRCCSATPVISRNTTGIIVTYLRINGLVPPKLRAAAVGGAR